VLIIPQKQVKYRRAEARGFSQAGSLPITALTEMALCKALSALSLLPVSLETGSIDFPHLSQEGEALAFAHVA